MNDNDTVTRKRHHLDMACEQMADELIAAQAELREARADRETYRELFKMALHALAETQQKLKQARETIDQQRGELREQAAELARLQAVMDSQVTDTFDLPTPPEASLPC